MNILQQSHKLPTKRKHEPKARHNDPWQQVIGRSLHEFQWKKITDRKHYYSPVHLVSFSIMFEFILTSLKPIAIKEVSATAISTMKVVTMYAAWKLYFDSCASWYRGLGIDRKCISSGIEITQDNILIRRNPQMITVAAGRRRNPKKLCTRAIALSSLQLLFNTDRLYCTQYCVSCKIK